MLRERLGNDMKVVRNFKPLTNEDIAQRWAKHVDADRQDWKLLKSEDVNIGYMNDHLVSQLEFTYKKPDGTTFSTPRKIIKKADYVRDWSNLWDHIESFIPALIKVAPENTISLTISVDTTFEPDEDPFKTYANFDFVQEGEDIPLKFGLNLWGTTARFMGGCMKKALESQSYWRKFKKYHPDAVLR